MTVMSGPAGFHIRRTFGGVDQDSSGATAAICCIQLKIGRSFKTTSRVPAELWINAGRIVGFKIHSLSRHPRRRGGGAVGSGETFSKMCPPHIHTCDSYLRPPLTGHRHLIQPRNQPPPRPHALLFLRTPRQRRPVSNDNASTPRPRHHDIQPSQIL